MTVDSFPYPAGRGGMLNTSYRDDGEPVKQKQKGGRKRSNEGSSVKKMME